MVNTLQVKIENMFCETPENCTLRLATYFDYKPGQFIQVTMPGDPVKRSYSFSSSPTEKGHLDITVKAVPQGHLSPKLVKMEPGQELTIKGPFGTFGLPEPLAGPLVYIAAGSGVTPFRSMGKYLLDNGNTIPQYLFYSAKVPQELMFRVEFEQWASEHPSFHFLPTVTKCEESEGCRWSGPKGRITEEFIRQNLPSLDAYYYICGAPPFVTSMEHLLGTTLGVPAQRIHREKW